MFRSDSAQNLWGLSVTAKHAATFLSERQRNWFPLSALEMPKGQTLEMRSSVSR